MHAVACKYALLFRVHMCMYFDLSTGRYRQFWAAWISAFHAFVAVCGCMSDDFSRNTCTYETLLIEWDTSRLIAEINRHIAMRICRWTMHSRNVHMSYELCISHMNCIIFLLSGVYIWSNVQPHVAVYVCVTCAKNRATYALAGLLMWSSWQGRFHAYIGQMKSKKHHSPEQCAYCIAGQRSSPRQAGIMSDQDMFYLPVNGNSSVHELLVCDKMGIISTGWVEHTACPVLHLQCSSKDQNCRDQDVHTRVSSFGVLYAEYNHKIRRITCHHIK